MKDIIVIGSGISGMTCACALANKGYNVTVLEKHSVAGGYCQSFSRSMAVTVLTAYSVLLE